MRNSVLFVLTMLVATLCSGAEVYPAKPVRVIVSFAPGGGDDIVARGLAPQLSSQLGNTFIVDNRTGASGVVGWDIVAKARPDGYTLGLLDPAFSILPSMSKSMPFDAVKDFAPISQILRVPLVLVVRPSLNVNTLKEFISLAQANPRKFNYGSSGIGTIVQMATELFKITAKVNLTEVPYNGTAASMSALLGEQIELVITSIPVALPQVKGGKLRPLAVTTGGPRLHSMPDVPSFSEAGVAGMEGYVWYGLAAPAGTPKEIINKLNAEVVRALAVPSVKDYFAPMSAELLRGSPEEFSLYIRDEVRRWSTVVKSAGISPQ